MFSKKPKTQHEEKKRLKREKKEREKLEKKERKKKDKKKRRSHKRMKSYHEYNIDEHLQPIHFQPELRYSDSQKKQNKKHPNKYIATNKENVSNNKKISKSHTQKNVLNLQIGRNGSSKNKHFQSQSTPSIPPKTAIFEGIEDEYSYNRTMNGYKPQNEQKKWVQTARNKEYDKEQ